MLWSTLTNFILRGFALTQEPLQINLHRSSAIPAYFTASFVDFLLLLVPIYLTSWVS